MDRRVFLLGVAAAPVVSQLPELLDPAAASAAMRAGSTYKVHVPAGPLASDADAQKLGPAIAAAHLGKFTGQWKTVVAGSMSVVEVEYTVPAGGSSQYTMDVPAGPLWSNADAQAKCPAICASYGGTWNGQWTTVVPGKMSVAGCVFKF